MKKSIRWFLAFLLGQMVQIVAHAIAVEVTYTSQQLLFCVIVGLVIAVAVFGGFRLSIREAYEEATTNEFKE